MERPGNDPMPSDADNPVNITLPDGSVRTFDGAVTGRAVAEDIGPGLAKAALTLSMFGSFEADLNAHTASSIVRTALKWPVAPCATHHHRIVH